VNCSQLSRGASCFIHRTRSRPPSGGYGGPMSSLPARCGSSVFHRREFGPSQPYSKEFLSPNYKCVPPLVPLPCGRGLPGGKVKIKFPFYLYPGSLWGNASGGTLARRFQANLDFAVRRVLCPRTGCCASQRRSLADPTIFVSRDFFASCGYRGRPWSRQFNFGINLV